MPVISRRAMLMSVGGSAFALSTGCAASSARHRRAIPVADTGFDLPEKKEFTAPVTGRAIWQLTDGSMESKHSYYDVCPWSHDGRYLLFSSVAPGSLTTGPQGPYGSALTSNEGLVRIIDTTDWRLRTIARNAAFNSHVGTFAIWQPMHRTVFFNRADGRVGTVNIDSRSRWISPARTRMRSGAPTAPRSYTTLPKPDTANCT